MSKLVITGTGRCGTLYAARLLGATHEEVFRVSGYAGWDSRDVDVSAFALPALPMRGVRVVHLLRNPLRTVRSFLAMGFYNNPPSAFDGSWPGLVYGMLPHLREMGSVEAAVTHWIEWNDRLAEVRNHILRVEDLPTNGSAPRHRYPHRLPIPVIPAEHISSLVAAGRRHGYNMKEEHIAAAQ